MSILIKFFAFPAFAIFIYLIVDKIMAFGMGALLPELPSMLRYFGTKTCLFTAINLFIKILVYGWILKQMLAYMRTL